MERRRFLELGLASGLTTLGWGAIATQQRAHSLTTPQPAQSVEGIAAAVSQAIHRASRQRPIAPAGLYAPQRGDVRIAVISDLNSAYGSTHYEPEVTRAIALIPDWQPDLVICAGDMVAGQSPSLTRSQIEAMWAAFDAQIAGPLRSASLPLGLALGNHDASGSRDAAGRYTFATDRDVAAAYWRDPAHDPGLTFADRGGFPFYYSFVQNNIFFVVWDASNFKLPPEQVTWAEQALASPAAQNAALRIAIGHLPLFGVAEGRNTPGNVVADGDTLRQRLERAGVHTYISGHHHAYYPAHRGRLDLLHTGALGGGPRPLLGSPLPRRKTLTILDIHGPEPRTSGSAVGQTAEPATITDTTYDMATLAPIAIADLPRQLNGVNGTVTRRDLPTG